MAIFQWYIRWCYHFLLFSQSDLVLLVLSRSLTPFDLFFFPELGQIKLPMWLLGFKSEEEGRRGGGELY